MTKISYNITCTIEAEALPEVVETIAPLAQDLKITTNINNTNATKKRKVKRVGGGRKLCDFIHDHFKGRSVDFTEVTKFTERNGFARTSTHNAMKDLTNDGRALREGQLVVFQG